MADEEASLDQVVEDEEAAPGQGGPRSANTRRAILRAARINFATRGYERATIRAIAADAGIDASMVMRYFKSKAGLFTAAVTMNLDPPELTNVPVQRRGEYIAQLFLDRWERSLVDDTLVLLLRTAVTDEDVANQLRKTFNGLMSGALSVAGYDHPDERSALLATQLFGAALCRYIVRFEYLSVGSVDHVVQSIGPTIQRYLTLPASDFD
jgi:AcrR family transcriptional regulator